MESSIVRHVDRQSIELLVSYLATDREVEKAAHIPQIHVSLTSGGGTTSPGSGLTCCEPLTVVFPHIISLRCYFIFLFVSLLLSFCCSFLSFFLPCSTALLAKVTKFWRPFSANSIVPTVRKRKEADRHTSSTQKRKPACTSRFLRKYTAACRSFMVSSCGTA